MLARGTISNTDFSGKKIHLLRPIKSFKRGSKRAQKVYWECVCDCGNITNVRAEELFYETAKSCGCLRKKTKLNSTQMKEVCQLYGDGMGSGELAKLFSCSDGVIFRTLEKFDILVRDQSHCNRKYNINENIFDVIDTEEKAYWLGFLYADGSITDHRCVSIHLAEKDEKHLETFSNFIYNCNRIKDYLTDDGRRIVYLHAYNQPMSSKLIELGCVPNKTFQLKFPMWLKLELISHFVRGYFDGDGSIGIYPSKVRSRKDKNAYTSTYYKVGFSILSTMEFLTSLKYIFSELGVHVFFGKRHKNRNNNNYTLQIGGNHKIEKVLEWMYKDATIYLSRKYNTYLELKALNSSKKYGSYNYTLKYDKL
jgi:hypothetical protein